MTKQQRLLLCNLAILLSGAGAFVSVLNRDIELFVVNFIVLAMNSFLKDKIKELP